MTVNNGWKYQVLCCLTHSLEVVWNADKFLHLSEIFGFDFFQWWSELKSLLSEKCKIIGHLNSNLQSLLGCALALANGNL